MGTALLVAVAAAGSPRRIASLAPWTVWIPHQTAAVMAVVVAGGIDRRRRSALSQQDQVADHWINSHCHQQRYKPENPLVCIEVINLNRSGFKKLKLILDTCQAQ